MGIDASGKLNSLLKSWPRTAVGTAAWLNGKGYSYALLKKYEQNDWIRSIGHGAYQRADDTPSWEGAVWALQEQLELKVHVASKTALLIRGYGHYLPQTGAPLYLIGSPPARLPKWFTSAPWSKNLQYTTSSTFAAAPEFGIELFEERHLPLKVSSPERAIMEVLEGVPQRESLDECEELMKGLATLRSDLVRSLLKKCNSIKVKRLFLYLAEEAGHDWFAHLKWSDIDLGKGAREIVRGGVVHPRFLITVPQRREVP